MGGRTRVRRAEGLSLLRSCIHIELPEDVLKFLPHSHSIVPFSWKYQLPVARKEDAGKDDYSHFDFQTTNLKFPLIIGPETAPLSILMDPTASLLLRDSAGTVLPVLSPVNILFF